MMKLNWFIASLLGGSCLLSAWAGGPPAGKPPRAKYEPPDGQVYHGVCLPGYWKAEEFAQRLKQYRQITDKPLALHSWFAHCQEFGKWRTWRWLKQAPDGRGTISAAGFLELDRQHGFVPVIAWTWMNYGDEVNSPTIKDLLAGRYDWYLDDWIRGIKEFKDPVFIRLSHEMDGDWYPYSEGYKAKPDMTTAADFVRYWHYVVDRFRKAGVTNVAWVWCVNGDRSGGKDWQDYWPGPDYVDWLAVDVYSARNPRDVLGQFVKEFGRQKPIMIPEGGTGASVTRWNPQFISNAAWTAELFDAIEKGLAPQIKALCWFQWSDEWLIERDPEQLKVYRARLAAPRFTGKFCP